MEPKVVEISAENWEGWVLYFNACHFYEPEEVMEYADLKGFVSPVFAADCDLSTVESAIANGHEEHEMLPTHSASVWVPNRDRLVKVSF